MTNPKVAILMGSKSDLEVMQGSAKILDWFGVPYEMGVMSAHRTPQKVREFAEAAEERGLRVIIAGAGAAAHLAGFIAAHTILPVIGVPLDSSPLQGLDALLATLQMPGGVPVAGMAIGKAGAKNAGLFAVQLLSLTDPSLADKLRAYREEMRREIESIVL